MFDPKNSKSGHLSTFSLFEAPTCNDALKVQFSLGFHFYTLSKTLIAETLLINIFIKMFFLLLSAGVGVLVRTR